MSKYGGVRSTARFGQAFSRRASKNEFLRDDKIAVYYILVSRSTMLVVEPLLLQCHIPPVDIVIFYIS